MHVTSWAGRLSGHCKISIIYNTVTVVPAAFKMLTNVDMSWSTTFLIIILISRGRPKRRVIDGHFIFHQFLSDATNHYHLVTKFFADGLVAYFSLVQVYTHVPNALWELFGLAGGVFGIDWLIPWTTLFSTYKMVVWKGAGWISFSLLHVNHGDRGESMCSCN